MIRNRSFARTMYNKLAFKHQNSLALKQSTSRCDRSESKSFSRQSRPFQFILLPAVTCGIFITYWFILCPLIWSICYPISRDHHWDDPWPFYFWIVALLVWILIMIILVCIWRCLKKRFTDYRKAKSYGSDECETPALITNGKQDDLDSIYPKQERKKEKMAAEPDQAKSQQSHDRKKPVDLPPLSIHRHMSGNDIENTGDVTIENPSAKNGEDTPLPNIADNINRRSMQEYLTLVTVTPTKEEETKKSPKTPMSPRDLFFIDLIREAEKAESAGGKKTDPTECQHFFPNNSPPSGPVDSTDRELNKKTNQETPAKSDANPANAEANYFIANIESPSSEKTEVFLEIKPDESAADGSDRSKHWSVDLNREKPVLTLQTTSADESDVKADETDMFQI